MFNFGRASESLKLNWLQWGVWVDFEENIFTILDHCFEVRKLLFVCVSPTSGITSDKLHHKLRGVAKLCRC